MRSVEVTVHTEEFTLYEATHTNRPLANRAQAEVLDDWTDDEMEAECESLRNQT